MSNIEVISVVGNHRTPSRDDVVFVATFSGIAILTRYYEIVRLLMLSGFCLLLTVGCATRDELASLKQSLRTTETVVQEHTTALAAIKASTEALELPETDNGTEVISSENEQQTATDGNGSQTVKSQPEQAAAVRLFVTYSTGYCPPCNVLKKAIERGDLAGFEIETCGDFYGLRSYPAIRWDDDSSPSGKKVLYGWSDSYAAWLKRNLLPQQESLSVSTAMSHGEMKALHDSLHGGGFSWSWPGGTTESLAEHLRTTHGVPNELDQNYRASAVFSPRVHLRSVTRRKGDNWRSRTSYRVSCPSGRSS